jgi:8-oxo-dGTP pyrophosphatase MutT (NUDIX family)
MSGTNVTPRQFAVLIPVLVVDANECVLLTKRPDSLARYAGQVCLPGGERDPRDRTLEETALRETYEEVGIPAEYIEIFRELGWHQTSRLDRVKPFVGRVRTPCPITADPREVEHIFYLKVASITRDLFRVRGQWRDHEGNEHTIYTFDHEGYEVWGLTARILREAFLSGQTGCP